MLFGNPAEAPRPRGTAFPSFTAPPRGISAGIYATPSAMEEAHRHFNSLRYETVQQFDSRVDSCNRRKIPHTQQRGHHVARGH